MRDQRIAKMVTTKDNILDAIRMTVTSLSTSLRSLQFAGADQNFEYPHKLGLKEKIWADAPDNVILLVCFLMSFGVSGIFFQGLWYSAFGFTLNPLFIIPFAAIIGLALMRGFGTAIARLFPDDQTDAQELKSFVTKIGTITLGVSKKNSPAQCKIKDHVGANHYFMVLPDNENDEIAQGESVLLVRYEEPYFYGIKPDNNLLIEKK